jgi:pilus retraction protein PilT
MGSLDKLLTYAVSVHASDVHLVAGERPIFRQYGKLVEGNEETYTVDMLNNILQEVLPEHVRERFHSEHEVDFSLQVKGVGRFRANAFIEQGRPSLALRLVHTKVPTFEELGLPLVLGDLAMSARGIILASGSTGCGKSTTIARMIQHINENSSKRIITIEDPIEFVFANKRSIILQREIGSDTFSFSGALRSVLRQDPDVIMVGEMRDADSFTAALSMAETGHLVVSTLHTDTASQSIGRILNFFPPQERDVVRMSLAINLHGVFCQRLLASVGEGLVPAVEIMKVTPIVRKMIETNQLEKLSAAIETGGEEGMHSFNQHIFSLIKDGAITEEEGMSHASNPAALRMLLSGIDLQEDTRII